MGEVADLFAVLGLRIDQGQWAKGDSRIAGLRAAVGRLGGDDANRAAAGLSKLGGVAAEAGEKGARGFDAAGAALKGYLVMLGTRFGYDRLIKFNQTVQDAKISLSAMLQGNMGGDWAAATKNANDLYTEFQRFSQTTPVTTQQMLEFGRGVAVATFQAGGNIKDLTTITEMGTVAAKTLGANSQYASLELTEMLQGNVSRRMRFAQQLLGMAHVTEEQFREMNGKQRLDVVKNVLTSGPMKNANDAMAKSFSGVTSTLEDKLQITFGKIGVPLFEAITRAVSRFNGWLDRNAEAIERVGKAIGTWLADAFDVVSAAIGIVIDKGGALLDWLGQFVDRGEFVNSLLIAIGATLTVFAVRAVAAWLAALGPIGLVIAAVTAVVYFVRMLLTQPEKVKAAYAAVAAAIGGFFGELWDVLKSVGDRIIEFFVDDIPDAIVGAFKTAFEAVLQLPVFKQIAFVLEQAVRLGHYLGGGSGEDGIDATVQGGPSPSVSVGASRGSPSVSIGQVSVGDITVSSPNADPVAVGEQVRKVFHEELGGVLRTTMDQVA